MTISAGPGAPPGRAWRRSGAAYGRCDPICWTGGSLPEALDRAVRQWSVDAGVPAELRVTGEPVPLPPETELALFRATQEALTNTGRHASATRAVVSLSYLGDAVTLDIDDDGIGFSGRTEPSADSGLGLVGMRERIAAAGGELIIESAAGEGTTIAVSVPT